MISGGSGAWRSRGRREAMPKPVSRTCPVAQFTRILAGLMSLWTRPRWWTLPSAAAMPMARRRKRPTSIGAPSSRSSGSPPGSSSTSMVRPPSRTSSSGRTAHAPSSSSFNPYSCARRSRLAGVGCSAAGSTASTALRLAVGVQAPSPAEDAVAVLPQDLEVAVAVCAEPSSWAQLPDSTIRPLIPLGPRRSVRPFVRSAGRTTLGGQVCHKLCNMAMSMNRLPWNWKP